MTNAGRKKLNNSLISLLQLTIKIEDVINRIIINYLAFIKSAGKPQKFLSHLKGMHPKYLIICRIPEPQSLAFPRLQCHYYREKPFHFNKLKQIIHWPWH